MQSGGKPNDLGARTVDYGLAAMELCGTFPQGFAARHIAGQLVRAAARCRGEWKESGAASAAPRPFGVGGWPLVAGGWTLPTQKKIPAPSGGGIFFDASALDTARGLGAYNGQNMV